MLGEKVGWVSKIAFFILKKIKSRFGWCGPFIPASLERRAGEGPAAGLGRVPPA